MESGQQQWWTPPAPTQQQQHHYQHHQQAYSQQRQQQQQHPQSPSLASHSRMPSKGSGTSWSLLPPPSAVNDQPTSANSIQNINTSPHPQQATPYLSPASVGGSEATTSSTGISYQWPDNGRSPLPPPQHNHAHHLRHLSQDSYQQPSPPFGSGIVPSPHVPYPVTPTGFSTRSASFPGITYKKYQTSPSPPTHGASQSPVNGTYTPSSPYFSDSSWESIDGSLASYDIPPNALPPLHARHYVPSNDSGVNTNSTPPIHHSMTSGPGQLVHQQQRGLGDGSYHPSQGGLQLPPTAYPYPNSYPQMYSPAQIDPYSGIITNVNSLSTRTRAKPRTKRIFPCEVAGCGKVFSRKFNLTSHLLCHTTDRPFACTHCPQAFRRKHDLTRHLRTLHGEKKENVCEICVLRFARADALTRHMSAAHSGLTATTKPQ
ncbi:hypothetical protein DFS34DRAFT_644925 [Phlyctochytrium arcticum]|nr:hypothetical protein DFS34DRAFT_644925 [Phlyctochytrium arcticum]